MKTGSLTLFLAGILYLAAGPAALAAGIARDNVIIAYKPGFTYSETQLNNAMHGVRVRKTIGNVRTQEVSVAGDVNAKISELRRDPAIAYAEPNYLRTIDSTPNDPYYGSYQWNMTVTKTNTAWDIARGNTTDIVAIIDTGVSTSHPDLAGKIVAGYDFIDNDSNPTDQNGHGTHVAGIAAAGTNNSVGVAGVNWNARIMPVRVLDASGNGYDSDIADGIIWAADHGAKVINMSLGGVSSYPQTMQSAVDYAHGKGVTIVAAAGNAGSNVLTYPAACNHVIGVAATDQSDTRANFSNYGSYVDVAAPGVVITSTYWNATSGNGYGQGTGTSMASPHVAGLASLLAGLHPAWTPDQIESRIETTAKDLGTAGRDNFYGYGRIDSRAAIAWVNHFSVTATGPQTAGSTFSITVSALDAGNTIVNDFNDKVSLTDTTGTVSPGLSGNFSAGVWTGNVTVTTASAADRITAVYSSLAATGVSGTFAVNAAAANHIDISPSQITVGPGKTRQVIGEVQDVYGNAVSGASLDWSATGGTVSPLSGPGTTFAAGAIEGAEYVVTATSGALSSAAVVRISSNFLSDFGGNGVSDVGMLYDYSGATSRFWAFTGTGSPGNPSFQPSVAWYGGAGAFDAKKVKLTSGDYDGDGKTDVAMLYDYGNATSRLWIFTAAIAPGTIDTPAFTTTVAWYGGAGAFDANKVKLTSGDYNGDHRSDIAMLYDYGNATARLWTFQATGSPGSPSFEPTVSWYGGAGAFDANRVKLTSGDYDGDGRSDVGMLYDYGSATSRLWTFLGTGSPSHVVFQPSVTWFGGAGAFDANRIKLTSGDYSGDGKADVAMLYDYGQSTSRIWVFTATGSFGAPTFQPGIGWYGGAGAFDAARVKLTSGDYDGDGRADIGMLYDYGNATSRLWTFTATGSPGMPVFQPTIAWYGGAGAFDANRVTVSN